MYGISNNGPVRDDSALQPDNIYGITKLEGEKVVRQFFDKLPIAIVRISETYGPGDPPVARLSFQRRGRARRLLEIPHFSLIRMMRLISRKR